jgi:hypothetical protein
MPSTKVWYCCDCGFGPWNESIDYFCPNCQARRCSNCKASKISNRYNYGLPGEPEVNPFPEVFTAAGFDTNTSSRPFNLPQIHHEKISETLRPPRILPTYFGTGHQHSTDRPSISDIFQYGGLINSHPNAYYCCSCNDGPKLYENQPRCVNCSHFVCSHCRPA